MPGVFDSGKALSTKPALDPQVGRRQKRLRQGQIDTVSSVALNVAPATSTTVTHPACSSTSFVKCSAASALAGDTDITRIIPGNGSFVITHSASASARTHRFVIFTPAVA